MVLGARTDGRVRSWPISAPEPIAGGRSAAAILKQIAPLVGGGGGGREAMARAAGKDPEAAGRTGGGPGTLRRTGA